MHINGISLDHSQIGNNFPLSSKEEDLNPEGWANESHLDWSGAGIMNIMALLKNTGTDNW